MNTSARFVSYIFHPLLLPTYLFILLSQTLPGALEPIPASSHLMFIGLIFIITFVLPVLNLSILKTFGTLKSFQMVDRRERYLPFILISFVYALITYLFYWKTRIGLNDNFLKLMIVIDLLVIVATLATFFYKISVHSLAAWGIVGVLIPLNKITEVNSLFYPALVVLILTGLIMSARLVLQVHTLKEVMWGGIIGLATSVTGMLILF